jgi:hypothetical protein
LTLRVIHIKDKEEEKYAAKNGKQIHAESKSDF